MREVDMMMSYNPADWYWLAADGRVYSSASQKTVPLDNGKYQSWQAAGGIATVWPRDDKGQQTQAALDEVLQAAGIVTVKSTQITYKADVWRRAKDDAEVAEIEEVLSSAPLRQRRLYEAAQYLDHSDEMFVTLRSAFAAKFGAGRADELLAVS